MTNAQLIESLKLVNHSKESRLAVAYHFIEHPEDLPPLLEMAFTDTKPYSPKACWIFEVVIREKLELLLPHLELFCQHVGKVTLDGSIRPLAKICETLVLACLQKKDPRIIRAVNDDHLEALATACFDWLISEQKVAPQAYAMSSLFYLGKRFPWIHAELRQVLEQNYASGSAAYKARARQVFQKLDV